MALIRHFTPKIYVSGDSITRQGEIADGMYFIRSGVVECLTADTNDTIAYLEDGNYFGEIGVLLQDRRSISTRAKYTTICEFITKDQLLDKLKRFPEHEKYLKKVAHQRIMAVYSTDIEIEVEIGQKYPQDDAPLKRLPTKEQKTAGFCLR